MTIIKPSEAFKTNANWVSGDVRSFMKDQTPFAVDTVADVNDNDFEQTRLLYVRANNAFYRLNLSSTQADDGDQVLLDNQNRRYEKQGGITAIRERLLANRTYYVRTDGSDSNNGLANTAGGAFLTIQKAIDTAATLDLSIYDVTVKAGNGTYDIGNTGLVAKQCVGAGAIIIEGDTATPGNVILRTTGTVSGGVGCITSRNLSTTYRVKGVKLESTATGGVPFGLHAVGSSRIEFESVDLGTGMVQQIRAEDGATVVANGNYSVSGGAATGFHLSSVGGAVIRVQSKTVTLTGTLAFSGFANATTGSIMFLNGNTWSIGGSVTGKRYNAETVAVVATATGNPTHLPGDAAGTVVTGGQYT